MVLPDRKIGKDRETMMIETTSIGVCFKSTHTEIDRFTIFEFLAISIINLNMQIHFAHVQSKNRMRPNTLRTYIVFIQCHAHIKVSRKTAPTF